MANDRFWPIADMEAADACPADANVRFRPVADTEKAFRMSRNVALLITATIWPATLALFGAQALRGVGPISGNVFVWCALIGFAVGVAVYGHGWKGMHLVAGLSVPNVKDHERPLSRHRIAGLVSSGAGVGAVAVPLVTWMVGNATGIGLASQLAAAIVVVAWLQTT